MSRDELPLFQGGGEDFPPYTHLLIEWTAERKEHAEFQHLFTMNPDGHHTAQKIVLIEALANSQKLPQLTQDSPNAVGLVTGTGNPTAAAKLLLDVGR